MEHGVCLLAFALHDTHSLPFLPNTLAFSLPINQPVNSLIPSSSCRFFVMLEVMIHEQHFKVMELSLSAKFYANNIWRDLYKFYTYQGEKERCKSKFKTREFKCIYLLFFKCNIFSFKECKMLYSVLTALPM